MFVSPAFNLAKTIVFFTYMIIAVIFKSESVQFFKDLIFFTFLETTKLTEDKNVNLKGNTILSLSSGEESDDEDLKATHFEDVQRNQLITIKNVQSLANKSNGNCCFLDTLSAAKLDHR
jgi:hypothetical protein